jgi:hypothetical protein
LAFLFFAITSLRQRLKKQAQRPSSCGGRFDRRELPVGESRVARRTEQLKTFFCANRLQEPTTLRKKFSAALHILSKAARSFWRKTTASLRAREALNPALGIAPLRISRVDARAREKEFFWKLLRSQCRGLVISGTRVISTVFAELSRRDACAIAQAFRSSMSSRQSQLIGRRLRKTLSALHASAALDRDPFPWAKERAGGSVR